MRPTMDGETLRIEFEVCQVDHEPLGLFSQLETTGKSTADKAAIRALSDEITTEWWAKHKRKLLGEDSR